MTKFTFKAKDWNGKLIKGVLDLGTEAEVISSIRDSGLVPMSVGKEGPSIIMELNRKVFGRVGIKQISNFTRQLSTMVTAGLPLTDALSLLKNQVDRGSLMYEILDYALLEVRGGQSLGVALSKYQKIFGDAYIASINAGEEAGVLEEVLVKLADNLETENEFKSKVKGAMVYPTIVIIGMVIVAFIMMVFVIPKLLNLYSDFGAKMPASTQALMALSNFAVKFWYLFPMVVIGIILVFWIGNKNRKFRYTIDVYRLKLPIWGEITKKNLLANTIRTMSMLLSAGISLVEALKIVSNVADNEVYSQAYIKISERVQKGFSIANSFEETGIFPPIVNQMVATGEATGKLDEILMRVSDYFAAEAGQSVKTLTTAMEPLIMIVLGIGVAFLVVAVIMPIYNLTSAF